MKKVIIICTTVFLTITISVSLFSIITKTQNRYDIEYAELKNCYKIANLKREMREMTKCFVSTGVVDEHGCSGYINADSILDDYKKDLNKCLK